METMNLLDITIKYFNVIVFVMCIVFGMVSFFASWIAWRELHRKRNIIRSVVAAYNIAEDTLEQGRSPGGEFHLDPSIVQTVFNSLQEILNAVYGEVTGKPIPPREDREHGRRAAASRRAMKKALKAAQSQEQLKLDSEVPALVPDEREHRHSIPPP
jgi:hypothetical protein